MGGILSRNGAAADEGSVNDVPADEAPVRKNFLRRNTLRMSTIHGEGRVNLRYEQDRMEQQKILKEHKAFYAATHDLVSVLQDYENSFTNFSCHSYMAKNNRDNMGATVLHIAILFESLNVVRYLIERYADAPHGKELFNAKYTHSRYRGETPLHLAVAKGKFYLVRLLVQAGAKVNSLTTGEFFDQNYSDDGVYFGGTVLNFAVSTNQRRVVEYLCDHGADMTAQDLYGNTCLHLAVWYELEEMYDLLVLRDESGLEHVRNFAGQTPLQLAAYRASKSMFAHLLQKDRQVGWSFGPLTEYIYPLRDLDTFQDPIELKTSLSKQAVEEKFVPVGALELIVRQGTISHADLLDLPPLRQLLEEKWVTFGRAFTLTKFTFYSVIVLAITLSGIFASEKPSDYAGEHGDVWKVVDIIAFVLVLLDTLLSEIRDLYNAFSQATLGYADLVVHEGIHSGIEWLFRLFLLATFICVQTGTSATTQRSFIACLIALSWLFLLNLLRAFRIISQFLKLFEQFTVALLQWSIVYSCCLIGFSAAFTVLFDGSESETFSTFGRSLFSLVRFTLGEISEFPDFETGFSTGAAIVLVMMYILLVVVILYNMLIAIMASLHQKVLQDAIRFSSLSWAATIMRIERKLQLYSYSGRSGKKGSVLGIIGNANAYYKNVLARDNHVTMGIEEYPTTTRFPSGIALDQCHLQCVKLGNFFEDPHVLENKAIAQATYMEIMGIINKYDPKENGYVGRDAIPFLVEDLYHVANSNQECRLSAEAINELARSLDGADLDDQINTETLMNFVRVWRRRIHPSWARRAVLLVVNVQNDFCGEQAPMGVKNSDVIIDTINQLIDHNDFQKIIHIQTLLPPGHQVFDDCATDEDDPFLLIDEQKWPEHCVMGTDGADFSPRLVTKETDLVIRTGCAPDNYGFSGFWDNPGVKMTGLFPFLFENNIDDVFVCGLGYDLTVRRTVIDALALGFTTYVVSDAIGCVGKTQRMETDLQLDFFDVEQIPAFKVGEHMKEASDEQNDFEIELKSLSFSKTMSKRRKQTMKRSEGMESVTRHERHPTRRIVVAQNPDAATDNARRASFA